MLHRYLRRTGYRQQMMLAIAIAILGLALFSSLINSWETSRRMRTYLIAQGQQITENLARQSTLALLYHSAENARSAVNTTLDFPDVLQVEISDSQHRSLLSETRPNAGIKAGEKHLNPIQNSAGATLTAETEQYWRFAAPVYESQAKASPFELEERAPQVLGYVHVELGKETMNRLVHAVLVKNLAVTFSFAVVLLVVMQLLALYLTRPLNALSRLMGRAEAGESGMRAQEEGPRNIIEMAHAFNKMMTVLEEREAELKQSRDQALHTALMKAQFAATVSHEVRTPLNGVVGMLDMLKEMHLTDPQQECVNIAWNSSQALLAMINDILDFSKIEARKMELEKIVVDLRKMMEEIIDLLARQVQDKGLELGYLIAPGMPDKILGDATRIRQVLINLVGNAVKFTERGEVAIRISCVANDGHTLTLCIEVSDTGIGMDEEALAHVFDSFAQADRSTTRQYGGTGLGLAISKQLVELMGGTIGVRSQRGLGSTFWVTLPCQPVETPAHEAPAGKTSEDQALAGVAVLVLEESEIVRGYLEQTLTQQGMSCFAASNGDAALAELHRAQQRNQPYPLAIISLNCGNEDSTALVQRIHTAHPATRLLLLDRYASPDREQPHGNDAYLCKPLRMQRLQNALRRLLAGPEAGHVEPAADALPEWSGTSTSGYLVLIVEDDRTNQVVAAGMLAMCACHCEFAGNGWEAIEAVQRNRYDLILMDCNLPEMDGYEITARIRNFEEPQGRRTPIIAMTANTETGAVEKCLASGMDDFLAKPITIAELRQKLEHWLMQCEPASTEEAAPPPHPLAVPVQQPLNHAIFDKLREILGPALQHALTPFLEDTPDYLDQLEQAVASGDAEAARSLAHTIKGSSSNLGASAMVQLAREAEQLATDQLLEEIRPLLPQLQTCFEQVALLLSNEISVEQHRNHNNEEINALVLVVDDDRSTRNALRYTLQRDGFRVETADNGAQALHMLKRMVPDVILMDALMPVMDGFTACAQLQEHPIGHDIPVLIITALEDKSAVERAFNAGASDYIPKPIHFAVLSQRIRRVVDASRAEKRVRQLAYNDMLTGLPNRALFFDQLQRCIAQARHAGEIVAVLFLDLDRFKYINDTLGHSVGDRLLVAVGQRIRRSVRSVDCVARVGGDEFTVVLSDLASPNAAAAAAQSINRALAAPFRIDDNDIFASASIGISLYPHDGIDSGTLLKHADTAMYRAKKTASGFKFFESAMEDSISEQMRLEAELREVLQREELEVYYQPQARLDDGQIIGLEALLRWRHPSRGYISPVEFIPVAEDTGLINPIGEWVLRTACRQLQSWLKEGLPGMRMAVNVSVRQLLREGFVDSVDQVLSETGLAPGLLELEITESTLMENAQDTLRVLQALRELGVRLSIDDFGTGYSSLAYLKRFPVNTVKIDRSFVRDVTLDPDDAAIAQGIIALAHSLRLEVVAEGVETEAQLDFLRELSCDLMQGYLLSKAVPAQQITLLIQARASLRQR